MWPVDKLFVAGLVKEINSTKDVTPIDWPHPRRRGRICQTTPRSLYIWNYRWEQLQVCTSLVPRPLVGETAWQLPQIQTVYRCNVTTIAYLIQAVKVHVIPLIFLPAEKVLSCSWKQITVCHRFCDRRYAKDEPTKAIVQNHRAECLH